MADENHSIERREIPGFPGYAASADGRIWSRWGVGRRAAAIADWHVLRPYADKDGYHEVTLCRDRKRNRRKIHRLVLEAFVGPCPAGMECLHDNNNCADNRLDNLRWGMPLENAADKLRHGTDNRGVRHPLARLTEDDVREIRRRCSLSEPQHRVAADFGVTQTNVSLIVRRVNWKHLV